MIVLGWLMILPLSMAAIPVTNEQDPLLLAIEEMEGLFYELPGYDDPDVVDYEISSIGGVPIVSLLEMARKQLDSRSKNAPLKGKVSDTVKELHDATNKLHLALSKLEKGNFNILHEIQKAIQVLKGIEQRLRPDVKRLLGVRKLESGDRMRVSSTSQPALEDASNQSKNNEKIISSAIKDVLVPQKSLEPPVVQEIIGNDVTNLNPETVLANPLIDASDSSKVEFEKNYAVVSSIAPEYNPLVTSSEVIDVPLKSQYQIYGHDKEMVDDEGRYHQRKMSWKSSGML